MNYNVSRNHLVGTDEWRPKLSYFVAFGYKIYQSQEVAMQCHMIQPLFSIWCRPKKCPVPISEGQGWNGIGLEWNTVEFGTLKNPCSLRVEAPEEAQLYAQFSFQPPPPKFGTQISGIVALWDRQQVENSARTVWYFISSSWLWYFVSKSH